MTRMLELLVIDYDTIMIAGNMNFNLLKVTSKQTESLRNIMDSFGLINIVKNPTCFKGDSPSLLDVILTNRPRCFQYTGTILDGVSDFHATVVIIPTTKILRNRSYKLFNKQIFIEDLERNNMQTCTNLININAAWKLFCDGFTDTLDEHAPIKERRVRSNQAPYLNKNLKQAIWKRKRLFKKILRNRTDTNWEIYRVQRNMCVEIRRKSLRSYFKSKFSLEQNGSSFWKVVKPFITNKGWFGSNSSWGRENYNRSRGGCRSYE